MMRKLVLALFLLACCALPAAAVSCTVSATNVAFVPGPLEESMGTVKVNCPNGTTYHVALSAGTSTGATVTNRSMTGPAGALLHYGLCYTTYCPAGTNWGDTAATNWVNGTGTGIAQQLTVYGDIPAAQYVTTGSYTDTIHITVSGTNIHPSATTSFTVTVTIVKDCIVSATNMVFGNYTGAVNNSTSTVTVTCTKTTTYTVGLNGGTTSGGTVSARLMAGQVTAAGQTLAYSLSHIGYGGANWGNTSPTWVAGTGSGVAQPLTVYGQIAAGLHPIPGSYTDTITATVTY